ncbi:MAG: spore coat protein [Bacillota bacterium]|jgi:Coat F domain.
MKLVDRDIAQDMLLLEKMLAHAYAVAETESANQELREACRRLHAQAEKLHAGEWRMP